MSKNKNIENWFSQNAEQANQTPSNDLWNRLNAQLDETDTKKRNQPWPQLVIGVAAMLLIAVFFINPFKNENVNNIALMEKNDLSSSSDIPPTEGNDEAVKMPEQEPSNQQDVVALPHDEKVDVSKPSTVHETLTAEVSEVNVAELGEAKMAEVKTDSQVPPDPKIEESIGNESSGSGMISDEVFEEEELAGV